MLTCSRCRETKAPEEFHVRRASSSGRQNECKECKAEGARARCARPGLAKELRQLREAGRVRCSECGDEVMLGDMPKDAHARWGVTANCAPCRKKRRDVVPARTKRAYTARYRSTPKGRAAYRRHYDENKEQYFERSRLRRALKLKAEIVGTRDELKVWSRVVLRDPCAYCGGVATSVDHIVPLSAGGEHGYTNLVGACEFCNKSKGPKGLLTFLLS